MTETAFECRMCGHCCHGEGGIVMTLKDLERLAEHLGVSVDELVSKHTRDKGGKLHLATKADGYCLFFEEGCGVHPGRPDICRAWPYFRGNLIDELSWKMIQDYCPGVNDEAGHKEFVRQGKKYLRDEGLARRESDDAPNALVSDD